MSLSFEERDQLREEARRLLARYSTSDDVRSRLEDPLGFDEELWRQMVGLGWLGIYVPEPFGAGADFSDLAVILTEMGRHLAQSPLLGAGVLGAIAIATCDNEEIRQEFLGGTVEGTVRSSVALASATGSYEASNISVEVEDVGDSLRLQGVTAFVPDAEVADVLFVAALDERSEIVFVAVDPRQRGVVTTPMPTVDATRRLSRIDFDSVIVPKSRRMCELSATNASMFSRLRHVGALAVCCDALGAADEMLRRTAEYASVRHQFGRPIGSFQAVKHHCANMAVNVVASRASIETACTLVDDPAADLSRAIAIVKSYAAQACAEACGLAIQVHGGIGFTWESDVHLFFKRAKLDELLFGSPRFYRRRLADLIFVGGERSTAASSS
jgi:alkylation response protein AidB-like acyl-CoA dehydrogenase